MVKCLEISYRTPCHL